MCNASAVQDELRQPERDLRQVIPEVYGGYSRLRTAAFRAGALDARVKELIALGVAASQGCDGCIAAHARGAARRGATEEEVAEALGVVIAMSGGPGMTYAPRAFAAYREFAGARPAGGIRASGQARG